MLATIVTFFYGVWNFSNAHRETKQESEEVKSQYWNSEFKSFDFKVGVPRIQTEIIILFLIPSCHMGLHLDCTAFASFQAI